MSKLKIKIKPLFVLYVFLCVYLAWFNKIFYYVVAVVLHEWGHYIVAKIKGYEFDSLIFSVYGGGLFGSNTFKRKDDIIISLAGPLVNIILILCTIALWWLFPTIYFFTYDFVVCNLIVFVFNILPFYPLDGGRVVIAILQNKSDKYKILKVQKIISTIFSFCFVILFFISCFIKINFNLLFISLFLILNVLFNDNNVYENKIKCFNKKYDKPIEIKRFIVNNYKEKYDLIKFLNPHYYSIFEIKNNGKVIVLTEDDLIGF